MVKTIDLGSKFLIRIPKNVFICKINKMKSDDEINKNFHREYLKFLGMINMANFHAL